MQPKQPRSRFAIALILFCGLFCVLAAAFFFGTRAFADIYHGLGAPLPKVTMLCLRLSDLMRRNLALAAPGFVGVMMVSIVYMKQHARDVLVFVPALLMFLMLLALVVILSMPLLSPITQ